MKDDDQLDLALLRAMVDNAVDGIIAIDERGVIRLVNPAAEKLFGHPASSMVGHNVTMLMPEPYRSEHDGYLRNYLTTGVKKIIGSGREVRGLRKDGTTFPMYLSVAEVRHGHARLFTGIVHDLSKIRSAEEQIAHLERQHILILNAIGEGIFGLDEEGRITFANPAAEEMLGWLSMEIIGRSIQTIWPVPDAPRLLLRDAAAAGECYHTVDARFQRRDGTTIPVEFHCTLLRQQDRATGAVLSFLDITERKQAEEQLRRERDRAQSYLDIAGVMIVALDRDQRVTLVNRKACEILACRPEELLGGYWLDHIVAHGERELARRDFSGLLQGGQKGVSYFEYPFLCRDGQVRLTAWHNALVTDADGAVIGTLGSGEDITERRAATLEVQRIRAYLKNIIDSMPSVLVGVDTQGRVTEWNTSAERATGIPASQAIGQGFARLFPKLESQLDMVAEALRRRAPVRTERLVTEEDGDLHYSDVMVYPLIANGAVGAVIRVDDITNRVRIEQMMVQTEKMMSVGGLAAGMAHEINNPLSGVLQGCQNIMRRLSPELPANQRVANALGVDLERVRSYLEQRGILEFLLGIQGAATRATRIVADMLAFSRRSDAVFIAARVDEMLETVVRLASSDYDLKKRYDFRQIEIVRDYDPELSAVYCDRTEIEQVFLNVIKNAAQALANGDTPPPHRIVLRTRREGERARVEIEDNGPGMDERTRRRVFEPFFTTKAAGVGTGLGLSVSYFIISEQHHGSISVASEPGKGTCFVILLPLRGGAGR